MYRVAVVIVFAAAILMGPRPATAQRLAPGYLGAPVPMELRAAPQSRDTADAHFDDGSMAFGGLTAGFVGVFVGGYTGSALGGGNRVCGDDPCGLEGAIWGAALGMSAAIPLGVHLVNHRRGNYATELGASLAIGVVGLGLVYGGNSGVPLLFIPLGQLATSIAIERASSK
jgi:hypothetical protein